MEQQKQVDIREFVMLIGEKEVQNYFLRKRIEELEAQGKSLQPKVEEEPSK